MACLHPVEERRRVYLGGPHPIPGRELCALCGEIVFQEGRTAEPPLQPLVGRTQAS